MSDRQALIDRVRRIRDDVDKLYHEFAALDSLRSDIDRVPAKGVLPLAWVRAFETLETAGCYLSNLVNWADMAEHDDQPWRDWLRQHEEQVSAERAMRREPAAERGELIADTQDLYANQVRVFKRLMNLKRMRGPADFHGELLEQWKGAEQGMVKATVGVLGLLHGLQSHESESVAESRNTPVAE